MGAPPLELSSAARTACITLMTSAYGALAPEQGTESWTLGSKRTEAGGSRVCGTAGRREPERLEPIADAAARGAGCRPRRLLRSRF